MINLHVDKSAISTVTRATNRIIATKGMKQVGKLTSSERGKIIAIICAINAQENFIPLFSSFLVKEWYQHLCMVLLMEQQASLLHLAGR